MSKSLTETAKAVLEGKSLQEGYGIDYPSVGKGGVSNPNPVDNSMYSGPNANTLHPGTKYKEDKKRAQNGAGSSDNSDLEGVQQELPGATATSPANANLGAAAASAIGKDTSKSSIPATKGEQSPNKLKNQPQSVQEDEEVEGEIVAEQETIAERVKKVKESARLNDFGTPKNPKKIKGDPAVDHDDGGAADGMSEELELSEELEDFINEAIEAGLDEEEILAAIEENFEFGEEVLDEESEESPLEAYQVDMAEHVNALLEGENLSEEFHAKATTIFEAAVKAKLEEEVALLEQAYAETLEERVAEIMEQLSTDVDNYLNYVVEQWIEENEVAVESALRSELTEDFIGGLRSLFAEHYIDIPEEEVAVVEELSQTVEELEAKLNEEIQRNVALTGALNESRKNELVAYVCEGLTTTQAEKLKGLTENVAYTDDDQFIEKISTLRENYFPTSVKADEVLDRVEVSANPNMISEENLDGRMAVYTKALGRSLPK
jgi:hypothetical protein